MIRASIAAAALLVLVPSGAVQAQQRIESAPSGPIRVQLDAMPLGGLVTLLMRDVMGVPYVIAPEVLADARPVSVSLVIPRSQVPQTIVGYLRGVGLDVRLAGGTIYVSRAGMGGRPQSSGQAAMPGGAMVETPGYANAATMPQQSESFPATPRGSPLQPVEPAARGVIAGPLPALGQEDFSAHELVVVETAHRDAGELAQVLQEVLPRVTVAARSAVGARGGQGVGELHPEALVLSGRLADLQRAVELVQLLDVPRPAVTIRSVVFEVRSTNSKASALSVLASVMGDRLRFGSLSDEPVGGQFVRIVTGGISAVLSAVAEDGRFKIVAEPSLYALSGSSASINSGAQVPTLGSVSYTEEGQPIRSIEYRDSGVSLTVSPVVRGGEIELELLQERSSFSRTTTGVDDSPTLNRSVASSKIALLPGETVVMAALEERSESSARRGLFGGLLGARSADRGDSQLLILVQADIATDGRGAAPVIHWLTPDAEPLEAVEQAG